ncbi:MAG TPA: Flp pilus assembly protein CpaB [Candidatus Acidoferrales bacterium]|nr:Flp pilus assembly protein CpaB [Candidatus Acidoferrales bacterium]
MALLLATVVAGVITFVMYKLRGSASHPELTKVVAASHDLTAGVVLTAQDLRTVDWPASVALPGSFTKVDQVVDHPLLHAVGAKEPVLDRDLAAQGSGLGLSGRIPTGMRATSVRSNEIVGVAGFLYPGSHVDVLATLVVPGTTVPVTETILQDVEVLTAGERIEPDPQGKPQTVNVVTLLVSSEDSQRLLLASTQGTIQFVLRNSGDQSKVFVPATSLSQLAGSSRPGLPEQSERAPKVRAPTMRRSPDQTHSSLDPYVMEVIRGSTRTFEKF